MKVIVNQITQPKPPATYDIVGLTEFEAALLRTLLGNTPSLGDKRDAVLQQLWAALVNAGLPYDEEMR